MPCSNSKPKESISIIIWLFQAAKFWDNLLHSDELAYCITSPALEYKLREGRGSYTISKNVSDSNKNYKMLELNI